MRRGIVGGGLLIAAICLLFVPWQMQQHVDIPPDSMGYAFIFLPPFIEGSGGVRYYATSIDFGRLFVELLGVLALTKGLLTIVEKTLTSSIVEILSSIRRLNTEEFEFTRLTDVEIIKLRDLFRKLTNGNRQG